MKRCFFAVALAVVVIFCAYGQDQNPMDIILLLDTSSGMFSSHENVSNYITRDLLSEFLRLGDTFHLIPFSGSVKVDAARRVQGRGDLEAIIGRMLLQYPLENESDLKSAIAYAEQYVSTLPSRPKKIVIVTLGGSDTSNIVNAAKQKFNSRNTTLDLVQVKPGQPLTDLPSSGRKTASAAQRPAEQKPAAGASSAQASSGASSAASGQGAQGSSAAETSAGSGAGTGSSTGTAGSGAASSGSGSGSESNAGTAAGNGSASSGSGSGSESNASTAGSGSASSGTGSGSESNAGTAGSGAASSGTGGSSSEGSDGTAAGSGAADSGTGGSGSESGDAGDKSSTGGETAQEQQENFVAWKKILLIALVIAAILLLFMLIFFVSRNFRRDLHDSPSRAMAVAATGGSSASSEDSAPPPPADRSRQLASYAASQPKQRTTPYSDRPAKAQNTKAVVINPSGPLLLNLFVDDQNTAIGKRNIHSLKSGYSLTVGGGSSDFMIFLVPIPPRIGEIRRDGSKLKFIPKKPKYFPDIGSSEVNDCINKTIRIISDKNYELRFRFEMYEDPLVALNRLLNSVKVPG